MGNKNDQDSKVSVDEMEFSNSMERDFIKRQVGSIFKTNVGSKQRKEENQRIYGMLPHEFNKEAPDEGKVFVKDPKNPYGYLE